MFAFKKKYFLLIESIKDIDLENIKIRNKFYIIYRIRKKLEKINKIQKFRKLCKLKAIKFYVANDLKLALQLNSDGIYLSSFNRSLKSLPYKKTKFDIIGSAHNLKEIIFKEVQGCSFILLSKLFTVNYDKKARVLGVIKFNNFLKFSRKLIPLGGIKGKNLSSLKNINCQGVALLSEIKKKPAKIFNRLF